MKSFVYDGEWWIYPKKRIARHRANGAWAEWNDNQVWCCQCPATSHLVALANWIVSQAAVSAGVG